MYEFDESRRPLLIMRLRGDASADELAQMRADIEATVERAEPFSIVYDIVGVAIPPRAEIMDLLAWNRRVRARYIELYDDARPQIPSFAAFHMPSMLGNLLRFFQQMVPSTRGQQQVCATFEEALAACERAVERLDLDRRSRDEAV